MKHIDTIKVKIVPVLKSFKVTKAGIFGSYARGEQKKNSDIDILIEIDKEYSIFEIIRLKLELEKAVNKKVDIVEYDLIRKEIRENILNDEIPIIR